MLILTLVRHAKSSWNDTSLKDINRPLNERGKRQAKLVAAHLKAQNIEPDLILCSTAKRARQTLNRLLKNWPSEADVIFDARLYLASTEEHARLLSEYGEGHKHIMVVGHNPGLHMLAYSLAKKGDRNLLKALTEKFPTLAVSSLKLDASKWKKLTEGQLDLYITPKLLEERQS